MGVKEGLLEQGNQGVARSGILRRSTLGKGEHFDWQGIDGAYGEAFEWYGLWVYSLDPQEVAERIRSSSIPMQLVVALDDWAYARRKVGIVPCGPLVAAAQAADSDPWRGRLREALEGKDPQALEQLAASAQSEDLPPATAVLLARLSEGTSAAGRALDVLRQVRQRHSADFWVNHELASALSRLGAAHRDEALRYHSVAAALRPRTPLAHLHLGDALFQKGLLDEAIAEYREAIRLQKDYSKNLRAKNSRGWEGSFGRLIPVEVEADGTEAHGKLADALKAKGLLGEAGNEHREDQRIKRRAAIARGTSLAAQGKLDEAITEFRKAAEGYNAAFADQPQLTDDLNTQHRYDAACAAARAGCGQGTDADKLDAKECARLRLQALDWLRADLKAYGQLMVKASDKAGPEISQRMQHWLKDANFAGVRGPEALARLSEAERKKWQKLWEEVEALRQRAAKKPAVARPARP